MKSPGNDTIAAVATAAGGGIGIVRVSGPDALAIASRIFRGRGGRSLADSPPFLLVLGTASDPDSAEPIDEVLAVHMPEGRSYTGETTVEIQGHGGRSVLEAVLQATLRAGARCAGPGEFTKRAFLSGRLDLTQAEAVAELICAEEDEARRAALRQLHGAVGSEVERLRERLLDLVARVEAALDFEEGEIPDDLPSPAHMYPLAGAIRQLAGQACGTAGAPRGLCVAFVGRANSGKSSIFNYLLNFERSIVTPIPGTTRDYIEERSMIGGASITLVDTAGLRATDDLVEEQGVRRSVERIADAGILILVLDGSEPNHPDDDKLLDLAAGRTPMVVISKSDLPSRRDLDVSRSRTADLATFTLSVVTGEGFPAFIAALTSRCCAVGQSCAPPATTPNLRHREALERAAGHLDNAAGQALSGDGFLDRVALELLAALAALGEITGQTATEEILERIFSRFCVGK
ncbi:MAG: tRNA uridine-5-carboxymethylaminomethyl(34) synthesis GTPase MnmE [Candidatus Methylomirabilia bacterium]